MRMLGRVYWRVLLTLHHGNVSPVHTAKYPDPFSLVAASIFPFGQYMYIPCKVAVEQIASYEDKHT